MPVRNTRFRPLPPSDSAAVLNLSWWFDIGPLVKEVEVGELLNVLGEVLPEALPHRYGSCEPPQFAYEENGLEHFRDFVREHGRRTGFVWYPHPPVAHVSLAIPERVGGSRQGFRSGLLTIGVDTEALQQPGWEGLVRELWRRVSSVVRPFYGEVRTLGGYRRSRRGYGFLAGRSEGHPVSSWWWAGIPEGRVQAAVLGQSYQVLWPLFADAANVEVGLWFVSAPSWLPGVDSVAQVGPIPRDIAQPAPDAPESGSLGTIRAGARRYPPTWPFDAPIV